MVGKEPSPVHKWQTGGSTTKEQSQDKVRSGSVLKQSPAGTAKQHLDSAWRQGALSGP
jgi:hypothetical protein